MRCRHGVGKLAQNEPTQKQQRHGQAMEDEFPHTSRVKVATIPRNEWLPFYGDSRRNLWTPLNGPDGADAYTQSARTT
jgi:hypothetical protein